MTLDLKWRGNQEKGALYWGLKKGITIIIGSIANKICSSNQLIITVSLEIMVLWRKDKIMSLNYRKEWNK